MFYERSCFYSLIFITVFVEIVENRCDNIYVSLSQKVLNEGFHRDLQYTFKLNEHKGVDFWSQGGCRLALEQNLPSGAYVNADELQDLKRMNKVHACPVGDVDVEKPKHMSRPLIVHVYTLVNSSQLSITLPIHLRYHRAKSKGGYESVNVNIPSVFLRCPNNVFKLCDNTETVLAPCAACSSHMCSWHNITIKSLSLPVEMPVPVGDLRDLNTVLLITYIACFGGCLYIICAINNTITFEKKFGSHKIKSN